MCGICYTEGRIRRRGSRRRRDRRRDRRWVPQPIPREDSQEYTDVADGFRRNITYAIEDTIDQETQDVTVKILNIGPNNDERRLMGGEVQGGTVKYQATIIMKDDVDDIFALFRAIEENVE